MYSFRTLCFIGGAIALAITGCASDRQPAGTGAGRIELVGGDTQDWGTVRPGKLTAKIVVKNTGDGDLRITEVHPTCGCTTAPIDKSLLKPGQTGTIAVTLDVTNQSGIVQKTVQIASSDSATPTKVLHLKASIKRELTFEPMQYMMAPDVHVGTEAKTSPLVIKNTGDAPVTIFKPEQAPGGNLRIRLTMPDMMVLQPGNAYSLTAFITPKDTTGVYGTLIMRTTSAESPSVSISVSGSIAAKPNPGK